jgi:hypothetical protein
VQRPPRRKTIKNSSPPKSPDKQTEYPNSADIWLSRLSHISQFGLFALTIGAFYFTVIPLYKTAALEENIARKEDELSTINKKLNEATSSLKKIKTEVYERNRKDLIEGIVSRSPYCSGLMTPPSKRNSPIERELGHNTLKIDAADCLTRAFNEWSSNTALTAADYSHLKNTVKEISENLSRLQKKALSDIESVPILAANDPSILAPPGHYEKEAEDLDELIEALAPGTINKDLRFEMAISRTRSKISMDFVNDVGTEFLKLRKIDWPDPYQQP